VQCKGNGLCVHLKQRSKCKDCGGSSICAHGKQKHYCVDCGGTSICPHKKRKKICKECRLASLNAASETAKPDALAPESALRQISET
jgi:hypothetical protein